MNTLPNQQERRVGPFDRLGLSMLCRRDVPAASAKEVIGWWESRRVPFNFIVGTAGILTVIIVGVVGLGSSILFHSDFGMPDPPIFAVFGVLIYGIIANVCYTGGSLAELLIRKIWPSEADKFAALSFSTGLVFSVVLTLAPGVLIAAGAVYELLVRFRAPHP